MKSFYFFGITDFQDMLPTLLTVAKREKVWIAIFDCLLKKRQFYYYSRKELINYFDSLLIENNVRHNANITFYDINEKSNYKIDFNLYKPSLIFMQGINHKYPKWLPDIQNVKVVHFTWGREGINNINKSRIKNNIVFNILRDPEDEKAYKQNNFKAKYFGNAWLESINNFTQAGYDNFHARVKDKKILFLPETWVSADHKLWTPSEVEKIIDPVIKVAQSLNYFVIIKRREKGYPTNMKNGFVNYLNEVPDLIIEKDLFFPSILYAAPLFSHKILLIGNKTQGTKLILDMYSTLGYKNVLHVEPKHFILDKVINFCKIIHYDLNLKKEITQQASIKLLEYLDENIC